MRKFISLLTCLVLVFALCVSAQAAEKIIMRIGCIPVPPAPQSVAAEEFKRILESKVGDRVEVQVYHALQLGSIPQHIQGLQNGSIHALFFPNGFWGPIVPEIQILDLSFFFPDPEWVYQMFNKGYMDPLVKGMEKKGIVLLSIPPCPHRSVFLNRKVAGQADFRGLRVRTYSSPISQKTLAAMGFEPVNVDGSEMAVAIQQGTVDGIETDLSFWHTAKYFKANYWLDFYKGSNVHLSTFSKVWFDKLPADIQQAVREAALEMPPVLHDFLEKDLLPRILVDPEVKEAGLEKIELPAGDIEAIRARIVAVHEEYKKLGPSFAETYEYYKGLMEQYPNGDAPAQNK